MLLLDSNIIIYSGIIDQEQLRSWLRVRKLSVSAISWLEVLGYYALTEKDKAYFEQFFGRCFTYDISKTIVHEAIQLRQNKKMSLGDAIIAATALERRLTLATANIKDFDHIENLSLINPMEMI